MPTTFTNLPVDNNGEAIQVLAPDTTNAVTAAVAVSGGSSAVLALPTASNIVTITTTQDTWIKWGTGSTVAAPANANVLILAGERAYRIPSGVTHLAFIGNTADAGVISIACLI